jgi:hypothetical protein
MKKIASMPKAPEFPKPPSADEIAELADRNEDVSRFFSMKGRMMTKKIDAVTHVTRGDVLDDLGF